MQRFGWFLRRLTRMSPAEIGHRMGKAAVNRLQACGIATASRNYSPDTEAPILHCLVAPETLDPERYARAADRVCAGKLKIFAIDEMQQEAIQWNKDPLTGTDAPLVFGKRLDYRDEQLVGDIKYLWEPNRHLQIVTLAQAYRLTGRERYLNALIKQLESWLEQCPYLRGPNWTSSLELGVRLINWSFVWRLIGGQDSNAFAGRGGAMFRQRWLTSVYQHAHFIAGHLSRYSSANNHLIGEVAGLFVAGCTWPLWGKMRQWRDKGYDLLIEEALRQNGPDGVNREQAIAYQQFVLDFLLVSAVIGRAAGVEFPQVYWRRMESMLEFIASLMDVSGNMPMFGDADDGYVVRLSQEDDFCPYRSLLATGAVLFERADFKEKAKRLDDKTRWLLGSQAERFHAISGGAHSLPPRRAFPEGGYYILGSDFETENEVRLIVDAGPLGYLSIAAHGHADALAFTLSLGGREFLIDPGTYAYHTKPKWRDYFRGTAAHNTVRVDGVDQSISGGNFMWIRHARAKCERWLPDDRVDLFCGSHDGYTRLRDPVIHRREIKYDKLAKTIEIRDMLSCRQFHLVERFWHFSEQCRVQKKNGRIFAVNGDRRIVMSSPDEVETLVFRGDTERPAGWISRRYDVKVASTTLVWRSDIKGATTLRTVIDCA